MNPFEDKDKPKSLDQLKIFSSGGWGNLLGDEGSGNLTVINFRFKIFFIYFIFFIKPTG